jgi:hypothetical protein
MIGELPVARLLEYLDDPRSSRLLFPPPAATPLAGHPLQVLRPPAARS